MLPISEPIIARNASVSEAPRDSKKIKRIQGDIFYMLITKQMYSEKGGNTSAQVFEAESPKRIRRIEERKGR